MIINEVIFGNVVSKANHYLNTKHGIIKDVRIRSYEKRFKMQCKHKGANINVPFRLSVSVFYDSKKCDLDNSLKTILDCLQDNEVISNDNLCVEIVARKAIDKQHPKAVITIEPLQGSIFDGNKT